MANNLNIDSEVRLTQHGYYELVNKPTAEALREYYAEKYYQQSIRSHMPEYEPDELVWKQNRLEQKANIASQLERESDSSKARRFLDVGAGEGFAMAYFAQLGWDVTGVDYSSFGCSTHNKAQLPNLVLGDIEASLSAMHQNEEKYDLILLDNVLEHVLNPFQTLTKLVSLMSAEGILIIEVPNDFSVVQRYLLDKKKIPSPFWVVSPDHISYFNAQGLKSLCEQAGLVQDMLISDYPIDFALFNGDTNYAVNKSVGKSVHKARVEIETLIHNISPDASIGLYKAFAELGLGRDLIGFFSVNNSL